ncbi:hypothetical protein WMO75_18245, partial [Blautia sp. CLA-AA-H95]
KNPCRSKFYRYRIYSCKVEFKNTFNHNYYTNKKWGAAKSYNLCIDSSKLGIENSVRTIIEAIKIFDESKNK